MNWIKSLKTFVDENYELCSGWGCTASSFMCKYVGWCRELGEPVLGGRNTVYAELRELGFRVSKGTGGQIRIFGLKEI